MIICSSNTASFKTSHISFLHVVHELLAESLPKECYNRACIMQLIDNRSSIKLCSHDFANEICLTPFPNLLHIYRMVYRFSTLQQKIVNSMA